jgi:epoxyqueuosine reductase
MPRAANREPSAPAEPPEARIRAHAASLGFDAVGFANCVATPDMAQGLAGFLALGRHGEMGWMAANAERRGDPARLWPAARSIVALGLAYTPDEDPLAAPARRASGAISVYARARDYHDVVKTRLKALARWMEDELGGEAKVFVDTAPVMEKPLAREAGLGWQGKHSNLVSRRHGSWLFLGEILTTLALAPDAPHEDRCGECTRCLAACPTHAFPAPYRLDARRCISYLTIEHKGHIADEFRAAIGNRIYGCDDCLAVCPWNKFARGAPIAELRGRPELAALPLADLAELDDAAFRALFRGTPIKRTGRDRFLRNVMIAIGNSGEPALAAAAARRLDDVSPLVRAMAVWALARLLPAQEFGSLRAQRSEREVDAAVRAEWDAAAPRLPAPTRPA